MIKQIFWMLSFLLFMGIELVALDKNATHVPAISESQKRLESKNANDSLGKLNTTINKNFMHAKYTNHQTYLDIEKNLIKLNKKFNAKSKSDRKSVV